MEKKEAPFWRRLTGLFGKKEPEQAATAPPKKETPPTDRRAWVRYQKDLTASLRSTAGKSDQRLAAKVLDISRGGLKLLVGQRFEPGIMIKVEMDGKPAGRILSYDVQIRYVAARGDKSWTLGVAFAKGDLSEEEMKALL